MKLRLKLKIFTCLLIAILGIQNISSAHAARVTSSIVIDALTGDVLHSHNADKTQYPASLTKLMTLYLTFNAIEEGKLKPHKIPMFIYLIIKDQNFQ